MTRARPASGRAHGSEWLPVGGMRPWWGCKAGPGSIELGGRQADEIHRPQRSNRTSGRIRGQTTCAVVADAGIGIGIAVAIGFDCDSDTDTEAETRRVTGAGRDGGAGARVHPAGRTDTSGRTRSRTRTRSRPSCTCTGTGACTTEGADWRRARQALVRSRRARQARPTPERR